MPRERVHHGKVWVHYPSDGREPQQIEPYNHIRKPFGEYPAGSSLHDDVSLDVTWSRDPGFVQVSIDMPVEQIRSFATDIVTNHPQVEDTLSRAIYTDGLTRDEINKMIHTLRRARDAAFGADA